MRKWLRLKDVPNYIYAKTGLMFNVATVRKWADPRSGKMSYSMERKILKAVKQFGIWVTTEEWVDIFIEEINN